MKNSIRLIAFSIALLATIQAHSQTLNFTDIKTEKPKNSFSQYITKDGATFKKGDTIRIGKGSGVNGAFVYITAQNWEAKMYNPDARITDTRAIIENLFIMGNKKQGWGVIVKTKGSLQQDALFFSIETALTNGEVKSLGMSSDEALTELKKCKDKLDLGLITPEEFAKKKAELAKFIK